MNPHSLEGIWSSLGKAWGMIGPLVGVLIGAWLSRSWQRKQWVLDSKKAEYRELIGTLSQSAHVIAKNWLLPGTIVNGAERKESYDAKFEGEQVISQRIFIDKKIRAANILIRWGTLTVGEDQGPEKLNQFWTDWIDLHNALVKMAHEDLGIKD